MSGLMPNSSSQPELHHSAFGSSSHPHPQTLHPHPPSLPSNLSATPAILPTGATNPSTEPISAYFKLEFPGFSYYLQTLSVSIGRRTLPPNSPAPPPLPPSPPSSTSSSLVNPSVPSLQPLPTPTLPSSSESTGQDANQGIDVDLGAIKSVSRLHARISYDDESGCFVLDVFGRNGAWVEDEYFAKGQRAVLNERTKIQISIRTFTFVLPPSPSPPPSIPLGLPEFTYADDSGPLSPATYALLEAIAENPDNALLGELDELDLGILPTSKSSKGKGKASGGKTSSGKTTGGSKSSGGKGKASGFGAKVSGGKINGGGKAPSSVRPPSGVHIGGGKASHHAVPPRASGGKRTSAAKGFHHEDSDGFASVSDSSTSSGSSASSSSSSSVAASLSRKASSSGRSSGSSSSASSSSSLSSSSHSSSSGSSSEDDRPLAQASLLRSSSKTNRPRATKSPYLAGPSPMPMPIASPSVSSSSLMTQSYPLPPPVPITAVAPPPRSPPPLPPTMPPSTKTKTKTKTKTRVKKDQTDKTKTKTEAKAKAKASKTISGQDEAIISPSASSSQIPPIPQSQLEESAVEEDIKPTLFPGLSLDSGQGSDISASALGQVGQSVNPPSGAKTEGQLNADDESSGSVLLLMDVDSPGEPRDSIVLASSNQLAMTMTPTTAGKKPPAAKKTPAPRRPKHSSMSSKSVPSATTMTTSAGLLADIKPTLPISSLPSHTQSSSHPNHSLTVSSSVSPIPNPASPIQNPPKTPVSTGAPLSAKPNSTPTDSASVVGSAGSTSTKHTAPGGVGAGRVAPSPLSQNTGSGPIKQLSQSSISLGSPLNSTSTYANASTGKPVSSSGPASGGVQPASASKLGQTAPSIRPNGTGLSTTPVTGRSVGGPASSSVNLPGRAPGGPAGTSPAVGTGPNRVVPALGGGGAKPTIPNTSTLRQGTRPPSLPSTNHSLPISPSITTGPSYRPQVPLTSAEILGGSTSHRPIPSHTSSNMSSTGRPGSQMPISSSTILSQQAALLHHHQIHYGSTGSNSGSGSTSTSSTAAHILSAAAGNFQSPSPTASASVSPPAGIRRANSNSSSNLGLPPTRPLHANPLSALIPMGQTTEEGEAAKPPLTYNTAILLSLQSFEGNQGTLRMICDWIMNEFEWYRVNKNSGWQNSLRHTLSTNEAFQKVPLRPDQPKNAGAYWKLDPACEGALMATAESEIKNRVSKQEKMRKAKEKEMGKDGKIGPTSIGGAGQGGMPSLAVPDAYPSNGVGRLAGKPISVGDNVLHKPLAIPSSLGNQPGRPSPTAATTVGRPPPAGGGSAGTGGPPPNGGRTLTISPNTRLPLLVSPIPAHLQTTPPHRLLESTPMAMYQGSLLLDPAIFSHVPRPQLDYLESLGQEKALKILRAYIVDHLKAKLDAQGKSGGASSTASGSAGSVGGVRPGGTPTSTVGRPPPVRPSVGGTVRPSNPTSTTGPSVRPPLSVRPAVGRPLNTRPPPPRPAASTVRPASSTATSASAVRPLVQPRPAPTLPGVPADPRAALSAYASNPQLGLAGLGPHAGAFFQYLSSIGDKADLNVAAQLIKTGRAPGVPLYVPPLLQGKLAPRPSGAAAAVAGPGVRSAGSPAGAGVVRPVRPGTNQVRPPVPSVRPTGSVAVRPSLQSQSSSSVATPTKAATSSTVHRAPVSSTFVRPPQPATSTNISRPALKNQNASLPPTSASTSTTSSITSAATPTATATAVTGAGSTPTSYVPSLDDLAAVLSMSPSSETPSPAPTSTPTPTSASTLKMTSTALPSSTNALTSDKSKVEDDDTSPVAVAVADLGVTDGKVKRKAEEEVIGTEEKKLKVE